jgi:hypothetical protein
VQGAGADHAGFVDDEDAALGYRLLAWLAQDRRDRGARNSGCVGEFACGAPGDGGAGDGDAGRGPGIVAGGEDGGLARAGGGDEDLDRSIVAGGLSDDVALFVGELGPSADGGVDVVADGGVLGAADGGAADGDS